jgi:hypothetical protein
MNVEIGTEAALFPEKEYINGIFLAVYKSQSGGVSNAGPAHISLASGDNFRKY